MAVKKKKGGALPPSFWKWVIKAVIAGAVWLVKTLFFNNKSNDT